MFTRRSWLALAAHGRKAGCYAICGFDGRLLEQSRQCAAEPPGSALKPLLARLAAANWRFACERRLRVQGRILDCVHAPLGGEFNLETSIAASCNSWFAQAARRWDGMAVMQAIRAQGGQAGMARNYEELLLMVLGLERVWFSATALALAYARLRGHARQDIVRGLEAALKYGTAARAGGVLVAGKTGTVRTGGWFAGWSGKAAIAVFVRGGNGAGAAATAARRIMEQWRAGQPA